MLETFSNQREKKKEKEKELKKTMPYNLYELLNDKPCLSVICLYIFGVMLNLFFFLFWICLGGFFSRKKK